MAKFQLAENLGMTVAEMEEKMSYTEFVKWGEFYQQRNASSAKGGKKNLLADDGAGLVAGLGI